MHKFINTGRSPDYGRHSLGTRAGYCDYCGKEPSAQIHQEIKPKEIEQEPSESGGFPGYYSGRSIGPHGGSRTARPQRRKYHY